MLGLLLLLGSCKEAAGPEPVEQAELAAVTASSPGTFTGVWRDAVFTCTYSVRVSAGGPPGALAHWGQGAVTLTMLEPPFRTLFDTLPVNEVRGMFGASTIRSGETQNTVLSSGVEFTAATPANARLGAHDAKWLFTYSVGQKKGSVTYDARCVAPPP
ncbi:MAG TPA: hypothetical protein VFQ76_00445 [Longimicrobiaceae bacterium]|nr:hypothetical protein [Longimicrobiaceae bacterium]